MRVATKNGVRFRNAHQLQHSSGFTERLIAAEPLMQADGLGNLFPHREHRIERGHRLLENHGNIRPAHALHLRAAQIVYINDLTVTAAQEHFLAADLPSRLLQQTHQRQRGDRFTGAGLANNRQRLAAFEREG